MTTENAFQLIITKIIKAREAAQRILSKNKNWDVTVRYRTPVKQSLHKGNFRVIGTDVFCHFLEPVVEGADSLYFMHSLVSCIIRLHRPIDRLNIINNAQGNAEA